MASTPYKPLHNWLQHHSEQLDALLGQVRLLRRVTDVIHGYLPQSLASHCIAANIDGDTLVVGCNSSVWATKLRYHIPTLLGQLSGRSDIPPFSQIRVRVQPLQEEHTRASRRPNMSDHSAALISSIAANTRDPALQEALLRLSRHAQPDKKS